MGARLSATMQGLGLKVTDYASNSLAGGPDSPVMEWMGRFLKSQLPVMVERHITTQDIADAVMADWLAHLDNQNTIFFSPLVVDIAARK